MAALIIRELPSELPIIFAVNNIINKGCNPAQVVRKLMNRDKNRNV